MGTTYIVYNAYDACVSYVCTIHGIYGIQLHIIYVALHVLGHFG